MKSLTIFAIIVTLVLSSCQFQEKSSGKPFDNFSIGVIETAGWENNMHLHLYDDELNKMDTVSYKTAGISPFFAPTATMSNQVYFIPHEINVNDGIKIAESVDFDSGVKRTYDIGLQSTNSYCVTPTHLFSSASWDGAAYLSILDLETEKAEVINLKDDVWVFIESMAVQGDYLYLLGSGGGLKGEPCSVLIQVDWKSRMVVKEINVSEYGFSHLSIISDGKFIYFTSTMKYYNGNQVPDNRLIRYDPDTDAFAEFELEKEIPWQVISVGKSLYILHSSPAFEKTYGISVFNTEAETSIFYPLEAEVYEIAVKDGYLFGAGQSTLYKFDIEDLSLVKTVGIEKSDSAYYIAGMFLR